MKRGKDLVLIQILEEFKSGSSPAQISKKLLIPKQTLNYYVGKLKKEGCIKKKGYGVWEYIKPFKEVPSLTITHSDNPIGTLHKREIRGHAFIWKIQFMKQFDWDAIVKNYKKKKLTFQLMKHNKIWRTIFKNRKIWLGKKGLTIYEPIDFLGRSSFEVKGKAVFEMDLLIKDLFSELGLKIVPYRFTTSREHYGIVKNELARQYNDKKEKMLIRSEDGSIWMWIDDSKGLGELENCDPTINRQVQRYWNNHKDHNFEVDASFVLNGFNQTNKQLQKFAQTQEHLDHNLKTHFDVLGKIGDAVEKLAEKVDQLSAHTK